MKTYTDEDKPDDEALYADGGLPLGPLDFATSDTVCVVNRYGVRHYLPKRMTFALPFGRKDIFALARQKKTEIKMRYRAAAALDRAATRDLPAKQIARIQRRWCVARGFKPQFVAGKFCFPATLAAAGVEIPWNGGDLPDPHHSVPRIFPSVPLDPLSEQARKNKWFEIRNRGKWVVIQSNTGFCDHSCFDRYMTYSAAFASEAEAIAEMERMGGASYRIGGDRRTGRGNYDSITNRVVQL